MNSLDRNNQISSTEEALLTLNYDLKKVNDNPDLFCLNKKFTVVDRTSCIERANDWVIMNKIMSLSTLVLSNVNGYSISSANWQKLIENVKVFLRNSDSKEAIVVGNNFLGTVPNILKNGYMSFIIEVLLSKNPCQYTQTQINQAEYMMAYISNERTIANYMLFCQTLCLLKNYFYHEFLKSGGTLQELNENPGHLHICYQNLPIKTPQCASLALNLQTNFHNHKENDVFQVLVDSISQLDQLEEDSQKVVELWQLYILYASYSRAEQYIYTREIKENEHLQNLLKEKYPFFTKDLKNFFLQFAHNFSKPQSLYDTKPLALKAIHTVEAQLDEYNELLQSYISKKMEIDSIYKKLYENVIIAKKRPYALDSDLSASFNFKLYRTPLELSECKILSIEPAQVRQFFRKNLHCKLSEFIKKPEFSLVETIFNDLFSIASQTELFEEVLIASRAICLRSLIKNRPYYCHLRKIQTERFLEQAKAKLSEFEMLYERSEERQKDTVKGIEEITNRTSEISISKNKSNIAKRTPIKAIPRRQELFTVFQEHNFLQKEKIDLLKRLLGENEDQIDIKAIYDLIQELQTTQRNIVAITLQETYKEICTCEEIIKDLDATEVATPSLILEPKESSSQEKEKLPNNPMTKKGRSPTEAKKRKRRRHRGHRKNGDEVREKEPEKEKEAVKSTNPIRSFIPLEHHKLFSVKKIRFDNRVADWFTPTPKALTTPSYSSRSRKKQEKQILFHSFPPLVSKIALIWGTKSYWHPEGKAKERKLHTSVIGQITVYEEGKEAVYNGVFTDCYDSKDPNLNFHHHFSRKDFNRLIEDSAHNILFQDVKELLMTEQEKETTTSEMSEFLGDEKRFVIKQSPGLVTIDDTMKKICYTVVLTVNNNIKQEH